MGGRETCPNLKEHMYEALTWRYPVGAVGMRGSLLVSSRSLQVSCLRKQSDSLKSVGMQSPSVPVFWIMWDFHGIARANVCGSDLVGTNRKIKDLVHILPHEHIRI
jgi:hypothetical protein